MEEASSSDTLSDIVRRECLKLGIEPLKPQKVLKEVSVSDEEKALISKQVFGEELDFSVPVNLHDSKQAFLSVVSGLNEDITSFRDLWQEFKPHNPREDYNPMGPGGLDMSSFFKD